MSVRETEREGSADRGVGRRRREVDNLESCYHNFESCEVVGGCGMGERGGDESG